MIQGKQFLIQNGGFMEARGESHGLAKLTAEDIRRIRASKDMIKCIAIDFNIARQTVRCIRKRITWGHIS